MNDKKFSSKVKKIISASRDEALRLGQDFIGTEHLLLGLIREADTLACKTLDSLDVDPVELQQIIEETVHRPRTKRGE